MAKALQHDPPALGAQLSTACATDNEPVPDTARSRRANAIVSQPRWYKISVRSSEDRIAFEILKLAINKLLSDLILNIHPTNESQQVTMAKLQARYGPDAKPETIAEILARTVLVEHATEQFRPHAADNQEG